MSAGARTIAEGGMRGNEVGTWELEENIIRRPYYIVL